MVMPCVPRPEREQNTFWPLVFEPRACLTYIYIYIMPPDNCRRHTPNHINYQTPHESFAGAPVKVKEAPADSVPAGAEVAAVRSEKEDAA